MSKVSENGAQYYISPEELKGIAEIRTLFNGTIPADLDTDFHLRRWIHGWKGQLNEIEPRLKTYIENRKAAKLDGPDYLETYDTQPLLKKVLSCFAISREKSVINSKDNCVFYVQRIENVDMNGAIKTLTCGDFLSSNFAMLEGFQRQVLKQENLSQRTSGLTILYDMTGIRISDFLHPTSPLNKLNKLSMKLFQDNYCELLHRIYVINVPSLFTLLWDIFKRFMNKNTQEKFIVVGSNYEETLKQYIDVDILPVRYGGTKTDKSGLVNPETLCNEPAVITEKDYYVPREFDDWHVEHIKPAATFHIRKTVVDPNSRLSWQYWVNSDVDFAVLKEKSDGSKQLMIPRFCVNSAQLAEEGELVCEEPGEYILEFINNSTSWFSLKLEYAIKLE